MSKILIIDDEPIVLKSCERIFKNEDIEIDTAASGEEGIEKIDAGRFDIVITDLMMPGIGGMEVVKHIKARHSDIITIIFTGYATVETAREALKLGVFDYIPKPFTPSELRDVVHNAIKAGETESTAKMLDLMAIVSHELKSPVSSVHTTAETLYRGYFGKLDPQQQKIIESIIRNCQYLEDIIRSYIDLSKMEIDDIDSFIKEIDLVGDVIQPILDIPEYTNNLKRMRLKTYFEVNPMIHGDPNLLKIVVTNLINNAIKYGEPETDIRVSLIQNSEGIILSVKNLGVGISEVDMKDRLFRKFSRLRQKGTEGIKGSGLGLYISKKIVEKHGGRIWAESDNSSWSQFSLFLPFNSSKGKH